MTVGGRFAYSCRAAALALLALCVLALPITAAPVSARADGTGETDDAYLEQLLGEWDMTGTFGGKAVRYRASGERVLQGGFLRLHMIDADPTPKYEADVFVGFDSQRHDFVAHWLDRFGAAGARVVGTGKRNDMRLVMIFPYASGAFRDTFIFQPASGMWSLLLESQSPNGEWSTFANYTLARPR
jgi:hypothetical protein